MLGVLTFTSARWRRAQKEPRIALAFRLKMTVVELESRDREVRGRGTPDTRQLYEFS